MDGLVNAAGHSELQKILDMVSAGGAPRLNRIRNALGDEAFLDELNKISGYYPRKILTNFAVYELIVDEESGAKSSFPIVLKRDRDGLWKIDQM